MTTKIQKQTGKVTRQKTTPSWQNSNFDKKNQTYANDENYAHGNKRFSSENQRTPDSLKPNKLMIRKRKHSQQPLRQLRTQRDLTLHKLAEITGLSSSYLSRLESGTRRFNVEILQKLAQALSCNVSALLPLESQDQKGPSAYRNLDPYETHNINSAPRFSMPDLPLYDLKISNEHSTLELDSPAGWVNRPPELQGVPNAISFQVTQGLKGHKYRPGEQIFAHPSRPLSQNCSVLAITDDGRAFVGEFVGWSSQKGTDNWMILRSYQPSKSQEPSNDDLIHVPSDSMKAVYRIIGSVEAA